MRAVSSRAEFKNLQMQPIIVSPTRQFIETGLKTVQRVIGVGTGVGGQAPNKFVGLGARMAFAPLNNLSKLTYNCLSLRLK